MCVKAFVDVCLSLYVSVFEYTQMLPDIPEILRI